MESKRLSQNSSISQEFNSNANTSRQMIAGSYSNNKIVDNQWFSKL